MVITISRQYGAGGSDVARRVAAALGWSVVDNELIEQVAERAGLPPEEVALREERVPSFIERLARTLALASPQLFPTPGGTLDELTEAHLARITDRVVAELAAQGRVVLVGRAAPAVLGQQENALHVKLVAPKLVRLQLASERLGIDPAEAEKILDDTDRQRARYHREYYGRDWADPLVYDMVLNTARLGMAGAAAVIVARARAMGW
ncbi:MAG TPA: cytidylate kinase-like family protein [Gemmatimonadales bacterium]|nr:cytidylate kinase-like family protein [Gemmatimonadales bacterium]